MMQKPGKNRRQLPSLKAFTLIEILTVVIIIGIVLAAALPLSIRSFRNLQLIDTARSMTSLMRYVQNKAILEGRTYRIGFDLAGSSYAVSVQTNGNFEDFEKVKTSLLSKKNLGHNLKIEYLAIKKEDFLDEDKSSLYFYPDGSMDEAQLVLSNTQDEKIIIETSLSGKINVIEE